MANNDPAAEYPKLRFNLILNRMEYFRAGVQWTAIPVQPGQVQPLENNHLLLGNVDDTGIPVEISGDGTLDNTGALTVTNAHLPVTVYPNNVEPTLTAAGIYISLAKLEVTLPAAADFTGQMFYFNAIQSTDCHITPAGAETIDGVAGATTITGVNLTLTSDGSNWYSL